MAKQMDGLASSKDVDPVCSLSCEPSHCSAWYGRVKIFLGASTDDCSGEYGEPTIASLQRKRSRGATAETFAGVAIGLNAILMAIMGFVMLRPVAGRMSSPSRESGTGIGSRAAR